MDLTLYIVAAGCMHGINFTHILATLTKPTKITRIQIFDLHSKHVNYVKALSHLTEGLVQRVWIYNPLELPVLQELDCNIIRFHVKDPLIWLVSSTLKSEITWNCDLIYRVEVCKWTPKPHQICFLQTKINMYMKLRALRVRLALRLRRPKVILNQVIKKVSFGSAF